MNPTERGPAVAQVFPAVVEKSPFDDLMFVNYEQELGAASRIATEVIAKKRRLSGIVFGYPGNGKRAFVKRVANLLWNYRADMLWIDVGALIASPRADIDWARKEIAATGKSFLLLVVDDLDLLDPDNDPKSDPSRASEKVMGLIEGAMQAARPLMLMAIGRDPGATKRWLGSTWERHFFYLGWPGEQRTRDFFRLLEVPFAERVAAKLLANAKKRRVRYTATSLIGGARHYLKIASPGVKPDEDEIVAVLSSFCSPTPEDEAAQYEDMNSEYISQAEQDRDRVLSSYQPAEGVLTARS